MEANHPNRITNRSSDNSSSPCVNATAEEQQTAEFLAIFARDMVEHFDFDNDRTQLPDQTLHIRQMHRHN